MFKFLYQNFFYEPLYNGMIGLLDLLPWLSVGFAVIVFTIIVKSILFPLSRKSVRTQLEMKKIEPEINKIKEQYKDDKNTQAQKIMALYKESKINPFAGILLVIIQLPILWALYSIFLRGGLPVINTDILYPFIKVPESIDMSFLGFDITQKSTIFALVAAFVQFIQIQITMPKTQKVKKDENKSVNFKDELARSMTFQMRFIAPIMIFVVARSFSMVVSLYLITASVFAIVQEYVMKRRLEKSNSSQVALNK